MKSKRGFSIVEVSVVLVIIAILATVGTFSYLFIQRDARDSQRQAKATLIAEGLEKFYDKNGEYPSPAALTGNISANTGQAVASKLKVDQETLVMPKAPSGITNSIATALNDTDVLAYIAKSDMNNTSCQTNVAGGCDEFTLSYKKERDNETVTIKSRHSGREAGFETTPEAPSRPTITATQSGTNLIATSSTPTCETGLTAKYSFQNKAGSGAWTAWTAWQTGHTWTRTGNTNAVVYQFQVKVRCDSASKEGNESAASAPVSVTYTHVVVAPSTPTVTVSGSTSSITATSSTVTCQTGETRQYKIDYRIDSGAWDEGTWATGATRTVSGLSQGSVYGFRATARCIMNSDIQTSGTSAIATYTVPVAAPSGLTISAAISGSNVVGTAAGGICGTGAAIERQIRYHSTNTSTDGTWSSYTSGATRSVSALQGHKYTFQQQARCTGGSTSSAWVTSGTANTVRPIAAPSTPTISASTSGDTTTYSRNNISCPTGTTTRYQYKYLADYSGGYETAWYGPTTGVATIDWNTQSQGYQYRVQMQAQCYTVHATSGWSGTGTGSYIRPVNPPGPISYTGQRINNRTIHIRGISSCGPGASLYSQADIWSESWSFTPRPPDKYGWYRTHFGSWSQSWNYYGTSVLTGTVSASDIPASRRFAGSFEMRCVNQVTGRQSATNGYQQSPTYTL